MRSDGRLGRASMLGRRSLGETRNNDTACTNPIKPYGSCPEQRAHHIQRLQSANTAVRYLNSALLATALPTKPYISRDRPLLP